MKQLNRAKLLVLLSVFSLTIMQSIAQHEIGTLDLKLEKGTEISSFVNLANGSFAFIYTETKQKAPQSGIVVLDKAGNLLNQHEMNTSSIDLQFVRMYEESYHFYFFDGSNDLPSNLDLIKLTIGVESGQASYEKLNIPISPKDRILGVTSDKHSGFLTFWNKKLKQFKVFTIGNSGTISVQNISIEGYYDPSFLKARSSTLGGVLNYNLIPTNPINGDIKSLIRDLKFYTFPGKICFTHEKGGQTSIYEIDLEQNTAKLIKRLLNPITLAEYGSNSYVFGDKLFKLSFDKKRLSLIVFGLASKRVIKEFILQPESEPTLLKSPIYSRDGKDVWHKIHGAMVETQIMLSWLSGIPWLAVRKTDANQYELELGSYQAHQWGNSEKLQKTQQELTRSFLSYLNATTYEIETGDMPATKSQKVKQYLTELSPEKYLISHFIQLGDGDVILLYAFDGMDELQLVRF